MSKLDRVSITAARAAQARISRAAPPSPWIPDRAALAAPLARAFWLRHWRAALGAGLLVGAGVALTQPLLTVATEHAVVSASLLRLRAPIGGELLAPTPGQPALSIRNPLADNQRLIDAGLEVDRLRAEGTGIAARLGDLAALAADVERRAAAHRQAVSAHLTLQAREAAMVRSAADARALRATREAARSNELARVGVAAASQIDRTDAERAVARAEGEAAAARITLLHHQAEAASRGVFTENGHIGTGYAEQRLDEIALRRLELTRLADQTRALLVAAEHRLAQEQARLTLLSTATVTVPDGLQLWRTRALPGQRVAADETIAEVVDCRAPFLLAAIPQSELSGLSTGAPVRLRLAGQGGEWRGTLAAFLPDSTPAESLAALPTRPREPSLLAQVALEPPPAGTPCPVGRTGRVLFDRSGPGLPRLW